MDINTIQKEIDLETDRISKLYMPPLRVKNPIKNRIRTRYLQVRHFAGRCYRFGRRKLGGLKRRLIR